MAKIKIAMKKTFYLEFEKLPEDDQYFILFFHKSFIWVKSRFHAELKAGKTSDILEDDLKIFYFSPPYIFYLG